MEKAGNPPENETASNGHETRDRTPKEGHLTGNTKKRESREEPSEESKTRKVTYRCDDRLA